MNPYHVELEVFRGPIDLLLYLVRKRELAVEEISLSQITGDYLASLDVLQELNIDQVGDFIEVASLLIEFKARTLLPNDDASNDAEYSDPRQDLVQRLLLYKRFKDVAAALEDQYRVWQDCFARVADDLPPRTIDLANQPIKEVELWDLVSAFGRLLRDSIPPPDENIYYDETPIHIHLQRIHDRIIESGHVAFSQLFEAGIHKSSMIGIFLAVLELVRHHGAVTNQQEPDGEIWIRPGPEFKRELDLSNVDTYTPANLQSGDPASMIQ